jgi:hypothetical protein
MYLRFYYQNKTFQSLDNKTKQRMRIMCKAQICMQKKLFNMYIFMHTKIQKYTKNIKKKSLQIYYIVKTITVFTITYKLRNKYLLINYLNSLLTIKNINFGNNTYMKLQNMILDF